MDESVLKNLIAVTTKSSDKNVIYKVSVGNRLLYLWEVVLLYFGRI